MDAPQDVLDRIKKFLNLANRNDNPEEAARAMERAQALLTEYNLTAERVEASGPIAGQREQQAIKGGARRWQRDLWEAIAELNFCLYWTSEKYVDKEYKKDGWTHRGWYQRTHMVVGRKVNVVTTQHMATYFEQVADRLARERQRGLNDLVVYRDWSNTFKRGLAENLISKMQRRRGELLKSEEARLAEIRANGVADGVSLVLSVYVDAETDANIDFLHGPGTAAAWAAQRVERARARQQAAQEQAQWAADNPGLAAEKRARDMAALDKRDRRRGRSISRDVTDWTAYHAGFKAGHGVSIEPQMDSGSGAAGLIGRS